MTKKALAAQTKAHIPFVSTTTYQRVFIGAGGERHHNFAPPNISLLPKGIKANYQTNYSKNFKDKSKWKKHKKVSRFKKKKCITDRPLYYKKSIK